MALADAALDVATFLDAYGGSHAIGTLGTDLFASERKGAGVGIPAACVFVQAWGGAAPLPFMGSAKESLYQPMVQVSVRGAPQDQSGPRTKARLCMAALHLASISGYVYALVAESEPTPLGQDGVELYTFVFNVRLMKQPQTT